MEKFENQTVIDTSAYLTVELRISEQSAKLYWSKF